MRLKVENKKIVLGAWCKRSSIDSYVRVGGWNQMSIKKDKDGKWVIALSYDLKILELYFPKQRDWFLAWSPYVKDGKKYADDTLIAAADRYNKLIAFS